MNLGDIEEAIGRARALLSRKRAGIVLQVVAPPWEVPGALVSVGLRGTGLNAEIGLYLLADGAEAQSVAERLRSSLESKAAGEVVAGTNGSLALVGRLLEKSDEQEFVLGDVASAFAGDE
ncbi:MAG: hypothetical protein AB7J35_04080 [Dehalococcoidia bacterium]